MLYRLLDEYSELRLLQTHQAEALFDLTDRNREHLRRWLPWVDGVQRAEDTRKFIQSRLEALAKSNGYDLTIWHRGQIAGTVGLFDMDGLKGEIGYWLGQGFEGQGLMSRSVAALLQYAFIDLGLLRVQIRANVNNHKSRAIPERLGFTLEGILRNDSVLHNAISRNNALYAMTQEDWENKRNL